MSYAKHTTVSIEASQFEAQKVLQKYGATKFAIDWGKSKILFELKGRSVVIEVPLPSMKDVAYTPTRKGRTPDQQQKAWDQACRQRWRALLLVLKAKLEAIEAGITTLDHEFMPFFLLKNGQTIADYILPQLDQPEILPRLP